MVIQIYIWINTRCVKRLATVELSNGGSVRLALQHACLLNKKLQNLIDKARQITVTDITSAPSPMLAADVVIKKSAKERKFHECCANKGLKPITIEILQLLHRGLSEKEILQHLSEHDVKVASHVRQSCRKFKVRSRKELFYAIAKLLN